MLIIYLLRKDPLSVAGRENTFSSVLWKKERQIWKCFQWSNCYKVMLWFGGNSTGWKRNFLFAELNGDEKRHWHLARIWTWIFWTKSDTLTNQFAGGSTKYFDTYHAEFPKPKRDPARELNCVYGYMTSILCSNARAPVALNETTCIASGVTGLLQATKPWLWPANEAI